MDFIILFMDFYI